MGGRTVAASEGKVNRCRRPSVPLTNPRKWSISASYWSMRRRALATNSAPSLVRSTLLVVRRKIRHPSRVSTVPTVRLRAGCVMCSL